ncbi:MAG: hypothetical protein ACR2O3_13400 [Rhizobiaceae bacterium]
MQKLPQTESREIPFWKKFYLAVKAYEESTEYDPELDLLNRVKCLEKRVERIETTRSQGNRFEVASITAEPSVARSKVLTTQPSDAAH